MNRLDYLVLIATILAIPLYGLWRTRGSASLGQYLKGDTSIKWATIGLSVLATQAGPITFLSMPGQAYESGIGFIQNYFGQPLALIVVCAVFVPIYQRLKVYTAYQYLGERFDRKTRLLGAFLFLVQRGIAAGITIYAPAIVLSALLGWRLNLTIWLAGGLVVIYTVLGGTKVVSITQRYQMIVILVGMAIAFAVAVYRLSPDLSFENTLSVAGKMGKLEAVSFSLDPHKRYTFWSGLIGGFFLALSYFGADQSQVQRYLAGGSLKESRLGLLFNAVVKVPLQFSILLLGAIVFMFYQFEKPPVYFNQPARAAAPPPPTVRSPATRPRAPARPLPFAPIPAKPPRAPARAPRPAATSFTRRKASARFITTLGVTGRGKPVSGPPASGRQRILGRPKATAHGRAASLIAATAVVRVRAITTPTTFCRRPAPWRPSMSPSNTLRVRKRPWG